MPSWEQIDAVPGWFSFQSFCVWRAFLDEQAGIAGDLFEIGVWKGRSASMLASYRKGDERLFLCDRRLDEAVICNSIRTVGAEPKNLEFVEAFSIELPGRLDLKAMHHTVRWCHIDGEHTGTAVYRELELANQIVAPAGILVIDDFFSPRYPANTTEVVRYLEKNPHHFRLLAVGFNKAYLCRPESLPRYMDFLATGMPRSMRKYGWKATIYKTTGPWDMDAAGMDEFIDAAGFQVGPDDDPHHWHMIRARHVWSPWQHVAQFLKRTLGH
ncbi:MAG TPA: class I SAM-dependent methyltransferase [Reyranella sp.]|jgi:hypothetical protein|nr:class I SAM-dependent methyltransferase [Reyranella sp.]